MHKGEKGRFVASGDQPRNKSLPTSVPMPSRVEEIRDAGMRGMWAAGSGWVA